MAVKRADRQARKDYRLAVAVAKAVTPGPLEGELRAGRLDAGRGSTWWAPTAVGWWIGVLFAIGSLCFTVGAAPGYVDRVGTPSTTMHATRR